MDFCMCARCPNPDHQTYILGLYWDNGKENGNYRDYRVNIGVMLGIYWGYIGIMENKMETTIV